MALTEVLIAAAIMGVILMAMSGLFQGQVRETRALSEKLAALDFQRTLTGVISIPNTCQKYIAAGNLAAGSSLTFNPAIVTSTDVNNQTPIATLKSVFAADGVTVLVDSNATNRLVSPLSQTLQLQAANGIRIAGYKDPTSGQINYSLQILFDSSKLVRAIHNINMPINATVNVLSATQTQITGCVGASTTTSPVQPGSICGSRLVVCKGPNPVYDQNCNTYSCSMKSTYVPCQQGVDLTATCDNPGDTYGYGNYFITKVSGCPQGWSGGHTMLNADLGIGANIMEAANIFCVKNP